jgi:hypothetical protein
MSMSDDSLADCNRCGRAVREDHSHVMVVPVGHKRMYFHAACQPPSKPRPDLAEAKIRTAGEPHDARIQTDVSPLTR